ncbi:MAG TPA: FAD-dependent oxidoreductase [Puia sp.]|jgi:glycine/D-amino acid oxidase-like deaminating enzyme
MKEIDALIVGQGLAGTWLSWWLEQGGLSYRILDDADPLSASRHAAGLINPVTGRRLVKTWMIDELMPFAWKCYSEMGSFLKTDLISETTVVDFFPTVQMLQAFQKRCAEEESYLQTGEPDVRFDSWFRYDLGWGAIRPCFLVQTPRVLTAWRNHLEEKGYLEEGLFDWDKLMPGGPSVEYAGMHYRYIVFCDGKQAARNRLFEKLPFALNKGEGLLVEIDEIPRQTVFKKGMSLVPWENNIYWVGSSYEWEFADERPTEIFRSATESWLRNFLRVPFKVVGHFAALRPATLERRPFAGFHPGYPRIGILNGLGTKGCSLAPYFAAQLAGKMISGRDIDPLADIKRFERILMKA